MRRIARKTILSSLAVLSLLLAPAARADDTIRHPGDHPDGVEVEPHGLIGWFDNSFGGNAFGLGARVSIPVVKNGFVKTINNSVAISFGGDFLFGGTWWCGPGNCGVNYLDFPVAMQWNFFVAQRWSVFGEAGGYLWHDFYSCPNGVPCPTLPSETGFYPAFFVGGRYHFGENVSLTMRLGFPTASIGVSFFL